jgi:molybdopterin molybdotransferase
MWKIAIKPGKPLAFGEIRKEGGHAWFIGLPGNPVSAFVTCLMVVRPFLLRLQGLSSVMPRVLNLPSASVWSKADPARLEFLRARIDEQGAVELFRNQGAAAVPSLCWGDGVVFNPPGQAIAVGDTLRFASFAELLA